MSSITQLTIYFVVWKSLILLIARLAPGPGYDTSATLLQTSSKLVRWDAIYYVQTARRGQVFEQEWAFGKGISTLLGITSTLGIESTIVSGIILSHVSHYVSVLLLWKLGNLVNDTESDTKNNRWPLFAACLHIISPAGIFLSAPYSESAFSCLNFLGIWLYLQAHARCEPRLASRCLMTISAGMSFGFATSIRSNGILSGIPLVYEAANVTLKILKGLQCKRLQFDQMMLLLSTVLAGLCIAVGLGFPQYLAFQEYCTIPGLRRPWCERSLPLIYNFVQSHYWNVGFLRYWTLSNLPLFLLAIPVVMLILVSSVDAVPRLPTRLTGCLVAPQFVLAVLAVTNYHVQIITRLSSGYPWHSLWLAKEIAAGKEYRHIVTFFVMYGLIQAGLFASFLPPA